MQPQDLLDAVTRGYDSRSHEQRNEFPVRGSALGSCPRALASLLSGVERNKPDAHLRRIFRLGTDRGIDLAEALVAGLPDWDVELERQVLVPTTIGGDKAARLVELAQEKFGPEHLPIQLDANGGLCILSHLDMLLADPLGAGEVVVVEIKTKASYGFKRLGEEGIDQSYQMQVRGQVEGCRHEGLEVEACLVLYENKDNQALLPVKLQLDDDIERANYERQMLRIEALLLRWLEDGHPDQTPAVYAEGSGSGFLPWQCNYCPVGPAKGRCVSADKLFNTKPGSRIPKWKVAPQ